MSKRTNASKKNEKGKKTSKSPNNHSNEKQQEDNTMIQEIQITKTSRKRKADQITASDNGQEQKVGEEKKTGRVYSDFQEQKVQMDPYLKEWITASQKNDSKRFYCKLCAQTDKKYKETYWDFIVTHLEGGPHVTSCKDEAGRLKAIQFLKQRGKRKLKKRTKEETQRIERELRLKFVSFILQNALPFRFVDDLLDFVKDLVGSYDLDDIKDLSLSKTTATKIAQTCIGASLKSLVIQDLQTTPYSLSIDESSDVFGDAYLALTAKYVKENQMLTKLVSVIELEDDKTGLALYNLISNDLFQGPSKDSLLNNCMAICTDQGKNMLAKVKGLSNRFQKDLPHLYLVHDYSHKYNLIGKAASKIFPNEVLQMIKDVSKHFSYSSIKLSRLEKVQIEKGVTPQKVKTMIRHTEVRWFSLLRCSRRIIELWDHLQGYFNEGKYEEKTYFTEQNYFYVSLFTILLGHLNEYSEYFQIEGKTYADVGPKLRESYTCLASRA